MEAARNAAEDAYFVPRHTISRTSLQEEIFRAGFERAYWPQVDRVETLKRELAEARSHHPMDSFRLALSRLSQEIERLRAALAQCYEHLDDQYKIVGIVDAALAGVPPYEFSRAADETTGRCPCGEKSCDATYCKACDNWHSGECPAEETTPWRSIDSRPKDL